MKAIGKYLVKVGVISSEEIQEAYGDEFICFPSDSMVTYSMESVYLSKKLLELDTTVDLSKVLLINETSKLFVGEKVLKYLEESGKYINTPAYTLAPVLLEENNGEPLFLQTQENYKKLLFRELEVNLEELISGKKRRLGFKMFKLPFEDELKISGVEEGYVTLDYFNEWLVWDKEGKKYVIKFNQEETERVRTPEFSNKLLQRYMGKENFIAWLSEENFTSYTITNE